MRIIDYIFYFFFYSFIGWFFESCYCSIRPKKWVNRGFLRGPLCPIYGTGALVIMISLVPLRSATENLYLNELLIFSVGMVVCDIVEFATSYIMEKLFHARWWDYSGMRFNIQGRICLTHTLYWGTASCLFCFVIHPIIHHYIIEQVSAASRDIIVYIILTVFAFDLLDTVINALGIRKLSGRLEKISSDITTYAIFAYETADAKLDKISTETKEILLTRYSELQERYATLKAEAENKKNKTIKRLLRTFPYLKEGFKKQYDVLDELFDDLKEKINKFMK